MSPSNRWIDIFTIHLSQSYAEPSWPTSRAAASCLGCHSRRHQEPDCQRGPHCPPIWKPGQWFREERAKARNWALGAFGRWINCYAISVTWIWQSILQWRKWTDSWNLLTWYLCTDALLRSRGMARLYSGAWQDFTVVSESSMGTARVRMMHSKTETLRLCWILKIFSSRISYWKSGRSRRNIRCGKSTYRLSAGFQFILAWLNSSFMKSYRRICATKTCYCKTPANRFGRMVSVWLVPRPFTKKWFAQKKRMGFRQINTLWQTYVYKTDVRYMTYLLFSTIQTLLPSISSIAFISNPHQRKISKAKGASLGDSVDTVCCRCMCTANWVSKYGFFSCQEKKDGWHAFHKMRMYRQIQDGCKLPNTRHTSYCDRDFKALFWQKALLSGVWWLLGSELDFAKGSFTVLADPVKEPWMPKGVQKIQSGPLQKRACWEQESWYKWIRSVLWWMSHLGFSPFSPIDRTTLSNSKSTSSTPPRASIMGSNASLLFAIGTNVRVLTTASICCVLRDFIR